MTYFAHDQSGERQYISVARDHGQLELPIQLRTHVVTGETGEGTKREPANI